ncbi:MAG: host nuclease inhibitor protein [Reyranella sp.]|nr:host nuclease inhibitor protein [Reyranella sp.]
MRAWCWASGVIGFGRSVPEGALPIMKGPSKKLRAFVEVRARHAYDGVTLLVPGVPEAPDQGAALDALHQWLDWNAERCPAEIEVW